MTSKPPRRRAITGDEVDAFGANGGYRRFYTCFQQPGFAKAIKRRANRRERREAKSEIWDDMHDVFDEDDEWEEDD